MTAVDDYVNAAGCAAPLLGSDHVRARWNASSALDAWLVGGLAGHLAWSAVNLRAAIKAPTAPAGSAALSAVSYFADTPSPTAGTVIGARIRAKGNELAALGHTHVVRVFHDAVADIAEASRVGIELDRPVEMLGRVVTVETFAQTRVLELITHADDLAYSVGEPTVEWAPGTLDKPLHLLLHISRRRHGDTALLRALTRSERAASVSAF